MEGPNP